MLYPNEDELSHQDFHPFLGENWAIKKPVFTAYDEEWERWQQFKALLNGHKGRIT